MEKDALEAEQADVCSTWKSSKVSQELCLSTKEKEE
jgi:hypothetical protein